LLLPDLTVFNSLNFAIA